MTSLPVVVDWKPSTSQADFKEGLDNENFEMSYQMSPEKNVLCYPLS